jgi:hypothetical protein
VTVAMLTVLACGSEQVGTGSAESTGSESDESTTNAEETETGDGDGDPLPPAHVLVTLTTGEQMNPAHSLHVLDLHADDPAASLTLLAEGRWELRDIRADGLTLLTNWDTRELSLLDLHTNPPTWHALELPDGNEAVYGRWAPNHKEILLVALETSLERERIWRVPVNESGVPAVPELLTPNTEPGFKTQLFMDGFGTEHFAEDGRTLAFFGRLVSDRNCVQASPCYQAYVLDLDDPEGDVLRLSELTYPSLTPTLHLTPDGGEFVFASVDPEGGRVWWANLDGGATTSELIAHYPGYLRTHEWLNPRTLVLEINHTELAVLEIDEDGPAITPIATGDVTPYSARAIDGGNWLLVIGSKPAEAHTLYSMNFEGLVAGPLEPLAGVALGQPNVGWIGTYLDPQLVEISLGTTYEDYSNDFEIRIARMLDGQIAQQWLLGDASQPSGRWTVQDNHLIAWMRDGYDDRLHHIDLADPQAVGVPLTPAVNNSSDVYTIVRAPLAERVLYLQGINLSKLEVKMVEFDAPEQVTTISPPDRYAVRAHLIP